MYRKIIPFILLLLTLAAAFSQIAFAHPGGTDGSGGHWNHSTGDYHYHHGYSAHSHRDMDGDGSADCPYDFKDATDSTARSSASYSAAKAPVYSATKTTPAPKNTSVPKITLSETAKDVILYGIAGAIVCALHFSVGFLDGSEEPVLSKALVVLAIAAAGFGVGFLIYLAEEFISLLVNLTL
jgi:hypothetical protein